MKHTKVLLYGNIGYVDQDFLKHAFHDVNVLILGETQVQQAFFSGVTILPFSGASKELYEVFDSYEFDQIVYFSEYLSYKNEVYGEVERLKSILEHCRKQENVKLLYIDGPFVDNGMYENTVIQRSIYNLIEEYSSIYDVDVKLLYTPYLYSLYYKRDYIHRMTESLIQMEQFEIFEHEDHIVPFIGMEDLADLVYKILDSWKTEKSGRHVLSVEDYFKVRMQDLVELMRNPNKKIKIEYGKDSFSILLPQSGVDIRKEYGWFQKYSILTEYSNLYNEYTKVDVFSKKVLKRSHTNQKSPIVFFRNFIEVFVLFIFVELLEFFTNAGSQFDALDFRLVLVAIVSIQYGAGLGVLASILVSIGFVFEYLIHGYNWHTLFYNLDSWMPIVIYLFVGSICGYFQMRKHDDYELLLHEKNKLEDKYNFTKQLYSDIILDKKVMKNEITAVRDGMGKIAAVMERLSKSKFSDIHESAKEIISEWFESGSVALFYFRKKKDGHYLFESTGIALADFPMMEHDLFQKGIFANTKAIADYPIYASLIHISKDLYALIRIEQVAPEHITLYDQNALVMLTKIIEAMMTKKYVQYLEEAPLQSNFFTYDYNI